MALKKVWNFMALLHCLNLEFSVKGFAKICFAKAYRFIRRDWFLL